MTGFLAEVGGKLADRWVALLALPGLLYLAVATIAGTLGQAHALDYTVLGDQITRWAQSPTLRSTGGAVIIVVAILAGSCMAGFAAVALGEFTEILWTARGRHLPARWLSASRQKRSANAKRIADDPTATPEQVARAIAEADRICLVAASRPTWIGDRLRACSVRAQAAYGIDLAAAWPRYRNLDRTLAGVAAGAATSRRCGRGWEATRSPARMPRGCSAKRTSRRCRHVSSTLPMRSTACSARCRSGRGCHPDSATLWSPTTTPSTNGLAGRSARAPSRAWSPHGGRLVRAQGVRASGLTGCRCRFGREDGGS